MAVEFLCNVSLRLIFKIAKAKQNACCMQMNEHEKLMMIHVFYRFYSEMHGAKSLNPHIRISFVLIKISSNLMRACKLTNETRPNNNKNTQKYKSYFN